MAERTAAIEAAQRGVTVAQVWQERAATYPPQRVVEPDEVAAAIEFLSDERSSGINGEVVTVALGGAW
jgi:NAD(P)-dependent dehydrogenase (short-subunit alcohol dehydrogenase family)